jgi:hypothetical protein
MHKVLIFFVLLTTSVYAQHYDARVDSISYNYFRLGKWDDLIQYAKIIKHEHYDFKLLRQRVGYAYFAKGDYYASIREYEKAQQFDKKDEITQLYLYYNGLNIGNEQFARYHAGKLTKKKRIELKIQDFRPIDAVDAEYSKKLTNSSLRTNPNFERLGLNTQLGYRLNLYQTFSNFHQIRDYTINVNQYEYFALLNWTIFSITNLSVGYHYVGTNVITETDNLDYPGGIWYGKLSQKIGRFDFSVDGSHFANDMIQTTQWGGQIGYALPTRWSPYFKSSVYLLSDSVENRLVFSQTAGCLIVKNIWIEGAVTFGNLNNFVDMNGLYFYNSLDPTTFRTGFSAFWYATSHLTFYGNYTFENKLITENSSIYNQNSITGGIIWKL